MKCAVEKKMLITQLLLSAPATEKFITICPGLDRAVSIDVFVSEQQQIDSALQWGTVLCPAGAAVAVMFCAPPFLKGRGEKNPTLCSELPSLGLKCHPSKIMVCNSDGNVQLSSLLAFCLC